MRECICSSCKNLKSTGIVDEVTTNSNNDLIEYTCEFGYPSDICIECTVDECELTCDNYISDPLDITLVTAKCVSCGKELKLTSTDDSSNVYCVTCYLNK